MDNAKRELVTVMRKGIDCGICSGDKEHGR